ncbi:hypothetical protein ACLKA7_001933 [Drosophila subpalustris]
MAPEPRFLITHHRKRLRVKVPAGRKFTAVNSPTNESVQKVSGVGVCTYADMLRLVKSDASLKHLSGDVQAARKTAKGDLLLRLSKKPAHSPEELQDAVGKTLGSRAVVKKLTEMSQVEIRDLEELVTKDEVLDAVKGAINDTALTIESDGQFAE